ncbi:MAG: DEAD/DEAH box helicase [Treponemataceae bacterium]
MQQFTDFLVEQHYINVLKTKTIIQPTQIQSDIIPLLEAKKNIVFQSETGTGKTFAYLLPLCTPLLTQKKEDIIQKKPLKQNPKIIILSPTLELASQIKRQIDFLHENLENKNAKLSASLLTGGSPLQRQFDKLKEKPEIIVGTAERIFELINLRKLKVDSIQSLVLDEVDRLFSKELQGFTEEVIQKLPPNLHVIACSATISEKIFERLQNLFTDKILEFHKIDTNHVISEKIEHWIFYTEQRKKIDMLRSLIYTLKPQKMLIFSANTSQVENIVNKLQYKNIDCMPLYAKIDKKIRKQSLDLFKNGKCPILVTSDIAARGLDISDITHVVQMDCPSHDDFFIHRTGRTARAGKIGINIMLGDRHELFGFSKLEKKLKIIMHPKELYQGRVCNPQEDE